MAFGAGDADLLPPSVNRGRKLEGQLDGKSAVGVDDSWRPSSTLFDRHHDCCLTLYSLLKQGHYR